MPLWNSPSTCVLLVCTDFKPCIMLFLEETRCQQTRELVFLPLLVDPQGCLLAANLVGPIEGPVRHIRKNLHSWYLIPLATITGQSSFL